jgi:hypothetical protein
MTALPGDSAVEYEARRRTTRTLAECEAAVGKRASITLTGRIVEAGESSCGGFVKFELDERWGFLPGYRLVMDLDPFEVESS